MKLHSLKVVGLFGRNDDLELNFHDDLNILTGKNGSGKTTILKLIWCIISGNIIYALQEINFRSCTLKTDRYTCEVFRTGKMECRIELDVDGNKMIFEDDEVGPNSPFSDAAEEKASPHLFEMGSSLFFPTFRRIEGGFSLTAARLRRTRGFGGKGRSDIDDALSDLAKKLSNDPHIFVSSISTFDINSLLLRRYAQFSEEVNAFQQEVSQSVIDRIKAFQASGQTSEGSSTGAEQVLAETRLEIEEIEKFRQSIMAPLEAVRTLVESLFQHSGIAFGARLKFGDAAEAINSDLLSAGEKQMLSFICYNTFYSDCVVIIDEPELSLHVDWQRQLFDVLESQNSGNQFFFATHSPFIYSKFPDKELVIHNDRGYLLSEL